MTTTTSSPPSATAAPSRCLALDILRLHRGDLGAAYDELRLRRQRYVPRSKAKGAAVLDEAMRTVSQWGRRRQVSREKTAERHHAMIQEAADVLVSLADEWSDLNNLTAEVKKHWHDIEAARVRLGYNPPGPSQ